MALPKVTSSNPMKLADPPNTTDLATPLKVTPIGAHWVKGLGVGGSTKEANRFPVPPGPSKTWTLPGCEAA